MTLSVTVAGQLVTFNVDLNGRYSKVRLQSVSGGSVEHIDYVGPVLDAAIRERIIKTLSRNAQPPNTRD
jgi:hypothetical protein